MDGARFETALADDLHVFRVIHELLLHGNVTVGCDIERRLIG